MGRKGYKTYQGMAVSSKRVLNHEKYHSTSIINFRSNTKIMSIIVMFIITTIIFYLFYFVYYI